MAQPVVVALVCSTLVFIHFACSGRFKTLFFQTAIFFLTKFFADFSVNIGEHA